MRRFLVQRIEPGLLAFFEFFALCLQLVAPTLDEVNSPRLLCNDFIQLLIKTLYMSQLNLQFGDAIVGIFGHQLLMSVNERRS